MYGIDRNNLLLLKNSLKTTLHYLTITAPCKPLCYNPKLYFTNALYLQNILFVYTFTKSINMKNLSLKMDDAVFNETERITAKISKTRNRYINEAVEFYNLLQQRKMISHQLQKESKIVQEESMKVLADFEKL